jgi:2OG-Fe(II) oxygenase superfamily
MMNIYNLLKTILLTTIPTISIAMHRLPVVNQCKIIQPFFSNTNTIKKIKQVMDNIENNNLGYNDYSNRKGLVWSDVAVKTSDPIQIIEEYKTKKVTEVSGIVQQCYPQSIRDYPLLEKIVTKKILPKMFDIVRPWTNLPDLVFAQIFFQRCTMSQSMNWHQDPGEDYNPQAHYSLVLMLSEQDDPEYGWTGGEFKIRSGLPTDIYDEANVETIIPRYNQAVIFNNQINSHAAMQVIAKTQQSKRDIIVIPFNMTQLSVVNT